MRILGTDIETTGLEIGDHRIIEFYGALYDWDFISAPRQVDELLLRIHPERSIAIDAQRIHGISLSDLELCPRWKKVAKQIHEFMAQAELVVAHNGKGFDLPFLNYEFKREGLPAIETPLIDTMLQGRWATPQGKVPNLGELCFACDVPYSTATGKAHAADYDVGVMMQCFFRAVGWGWINLPSPSVEEIEEAA